MDLSDDMLTYLLARSLQHLHGFSRTVYLRYAEQDQVSRMAIAAASERAEVDVDWIHREGWREEQNGKKIAR